MDGAIIDLSEKRRKNWRYSFADAGRDIQKRLEEVQHIYPEYAARLRYALGKIEAYCARNNIKL